MQPVDTYTEFLSSKKKVAEKYGFDLPLEDVAINNPLPHQPIIVLPTLFDFIDKEKAV